MTPTHPGRLSVVHDLASGTIGAPSCLRSSRASAFASISGKCNHKHASVHKPAAINAQVSSAFYAALGDSILRSLGFSPAPCTLSPLHQAQISLGLQPRKIALSLVPEFKHRLIVSLCEQPPLINGKLVHDLCLPKCSFLQPPSFWSVQKRGEWVMALPELAIRPNLIQVQVCHTPTAVSIMHRCAARTLPCLLHSHSLTMSRPKLQML